MSKSSLQERYSLLFRGTISYTPKGDKFTNPQPIRLTHFEQTGGLDRTPDQHFLGRTTDTHLHAGYASILNVAMDYVPEAGGSAIDSLPYVPDDSYMPPDYDWGDADPNNPTDPTDPNGPVSRVTVKYATPLLLGQVGGMGNLNLIRYFVNTYGAVDYRFKTYTPAQMFKLCLDHPSVREKFEDLAYEMPTLEDVPRGGLIFNWGHEEPTLVITTTNRIVALNSAALMYEVFNYPYAHQVYMPAPNVDGYALTKSAHAACMRLLEAIAVVDPLHVDAQDIEIEVRNTPRLLKLLPCSALPHVTIEEKPNSKTYMTGSITLWFLYAMNGKLEVRNRAYGLANLNPHLASDTAFLEATKTFLKTMWNLAGYALTWIGTGYTPNTSFRWATFDMRLDGDTQARAASDFLGETLFIALSRDPQIINPSYINEIYDLVVEYTSVIGSKLIPEDQMIGTYYSQESQIEITEVPN